jgi:hypothetical protein
MRRIQSCQPALRNAAGLNREQLYSSDYFAPPTAEVTTKCASRFLHLSRNKSTEQQQTEIKQKFFLLSQKLARQRETAPPLPRARISEDILCRSSNPGDQTLLAAPRRDEAVSERRL